MMSYSSTEPGKSEIRDLLGIGEMRYNFDTNFDFIGVAEQGLASSSVEKFRDYFGFSREQISMLLNISEPTLYRWLRTDRQLDKHTAIQLLELSDALLIAARVFSNLPTLIKWLHLENTALGGQTPFQLLTVPEGISKVRNLLGRIQYGVVS